MAMTRRAVARENAGGLGAAPWWRALGYSVNGNGNGKWKMENGNGEWKMENGNGDGMGPCMAG